MNDWEPWGSPRGALYTEEGVKLARRKDAAGNGSIGRRSDGRYYCAIMLGYKLDGKPNRRFVYGKTEREVIQKRDALKRDFEDGTLTAPSKQTVAEYLVGDPAAFNSNDTYNGGWLERHRRLARDGEGLRPNTYKQYRRSIKNHILPEIGGVRLQKLTPRHLENLYTAILDKGKDEGRDFKRTAHVVHQVIRTALQAAVDGGLIKTNPADKAKKVRVTYRAEERPRLDRADAPKVLAKVQGSIYYLPFLLAMSAGLRRGEILGLRWKNVDLKDGVIKVREQIGYDEMGKVVLGPVKTKASIRDIPIPSDVVAALKEQKAAQKVTDLRGEGFVCTNSEGRFIQPSHFNRAWRDVREELDLPKNMHLHDLRGSWVTWLAEAKVDPKAASVLAGHSDTRVTTSLYQSVTQGMRDEAAKALEGIASADV